MMIHQFKRGSGSGVGFSIDGVDFDKLYGKIGEYSGLKRNRSPPFSTNQTHKNHTTQALAIHNEQTKHPRWSIH
jgi:hypothetical protein